MATLTHKRPPKYNRYEAIRPSMTGSVGVPLVANQLATSMPDMPIRYAPESTREGLGSDLTAQPRVYDSGWDMGRGEVNAYGMMQQDLRAPDLLHEPTLGGQPQYDWRNRVATVYQAKRTGFKFLPLPGPYQISPGEMVRGGQVVRTTETEGLYSVVQNQQPASTIGLARNKVMPGGATMSQGIIG